MCELVIQAHTRKLQTASETAQKNKAKAEFLQGAHPACAAAGSREFSGPRDCVQTPILSTDLENLAAQEKGASGDSSRADRGREPPGRGFFSEEQVAEMKMPQLRQEAKKLGMKHSGLKKDELLKRMVASFPGKFVGLEF